MGRHGNRAPVGQGELGVDGTPRRRPGDIKTSERKRVVSSVRRDVLRYEKVRKKAKEGPSEEKEIHSEEKEIRSEEKEIRSGEKKCEEKKCEEKKCEEKKSEEKK